MHKDRHSFMQQLRKKFLIKMTSDKVVDSYIAVFIAHRKFSPNCLRQYVQGYHRKENKHQSSRKNNWNRITNRKIIRLE